MLPGRHLTVTTILSPYLYSKSLLLIWRLGSLRFHPRLPNLYPPVTRESPPQRSSIVSFDVFVVVSPICVTAWRSCDITAMIPVIATHLRLWKYQNDLNDKTNLNCLKYALLQTFLSVPRTYISAGSILVTRVCLYRRDELGLKFNTNIQYHRLRD